MQASRYVGLLQAYLCHLPRTQWLILPGGGGGGTSSAEESGHVDGVFPSPAFQRAVGGLWLWWRGGMLTQESRQVLSNLCCWTVLPSHSLFTLTVSSSPTSEDFTPPTTQEPLFSWTFCMPSMYCAAELWHFPRSVSKWLPLYTIKEIKQLFKQIT